MKYKLVYKGVEGMKKSKVMLLVVAIALVLVVAALVLAGPGGALGRLGALSSISAPAASQTMYVCPMHPEVTSSRPGNCPKCGMKLVLKAS